MQPVIWLIGGTSEGRNLIKALRDFPVQLFVSVATEYGAELIDEQANVTVMAERMDLAAMCNFIEEHKPPALSMQLIHMLLSLRQPSRKLAVKSTANICAYCVRQVRQGIILW